MKKVVASLCFAIAMLVSLIWLPSNVSAMAKECPERATCHTVQRGESLSKISVQYGVPMDDILRMNPAIKNRHLIRTDQMIVISEPAATDTPSASAAGAETKTESETKTGNELELKNKVQKLEADVLALTKAQAAMERNLKLTSHALTSSSAPEANPAPISPKIPIFVSGLLCTGAVGFLIGKLANSNNISSDLWRIHPRRPSRGKPPRDAIQTLYQTKARLCGGTAPWEVDIAAIKNPRTILLLQNNPMLFRQS